MLNIVANISDTQSRWEALFFLSDYQEKPLVQYIAQ